MKILIINNIASGYREGAIYDFVRAFCQDGDECCIRSTDGTTPIENLLVDALSFDRVVASGGDGTLATVSYALAGTGIPILPFPAGTANLLELNLLAPSETHALAKLLREGKTMNFDLGELECSGRRRGFGIMAGAGYDAVIMRNAAPSKSLLGPVAYLTAALTNPTPKYADFRLTLDGRAIECKGLCVLVINFSKIQFDISVTHKNQPRDGVLDVAILKAENAFGLIPALMAGILDRDGQFPNRGDSIELHQAHDIYIESNPPLEMQFDGEYSDITTPFHARVLPGAANFIVSDECFAEFSNEHPSTDPDV